MATQNLEQRLAALEKEVAQLKAVAKQKLIPESRGARLIRDAEESHARTVAGWEELMENLGIHGQPIGAKKLREVLLAEGINPDDNAFSREIIAMREE